MIIGLDGFTWGHIVVSLAAIAAGLVMVGGFLSRTWLGGANHIFIVTTVATSVSGFLFPFSKILPSHIVGGISLVVLAIAVHAFYVARLSGSWRSVYVVAAVTALYLNVFVLVAQTFLKNPSLVTLSPTQSELPFLATQLLNLIVFVGLGYLAYSRAGRPPG